ncbi:ABC transporter permease [Fructilactobacillus lindneri]|uniref:ABC transporter permease n=1 Tax=Fructilactobacillus lindneri TaxID=53444 RepID=UPI0006D143E7|nr:ABC transporter permease [Fructilactobacillus lindneri]POH06502.1 ABC transporter permease [Fructilactobacillus lindneri]POH06900.1 ABC transporter permease [Fructilactobacillus lindneri]POH07359.1 ABC transporter permease [Fructilactobacillus lindneri]POH24043.1 ABC transporter permease [Fructilactobacillus lindneri DSM 20690 = JCM 11027]SJZ89340.1 putative ABC transport system permease protein [Fructilactobacillus lindneri DSM 20690 = JCM 11027]
MRFLLKKLVRTVFKNWTQFFSVFLMAFLSVLFYTGLEGTWNGMKQNINHYTTRTHLATTTLQSTGLSENEVKQIKNLPDVSKISAQTEINTTTHLKGSKRYLAVSTPGTQQLSKTLQTNGQRINTKVSGIYLNEKFAQTNGLHKNSTVTVKFNNQPVKLKVAGLVNSPDKMYYTGSNDFISPQNQNYGYGFISDKTLMNKFKLPLLNNVIEIKDSNNQQVEKQIRKLIGKKYIALQTQKSNVGIATAVDRVGQIRNISILFSIIFILLAVLAMYTTIRKIIDQQQRDMATLQSLGYSNVILSLYYSMYGLLVGGIGALVGLAVAPLLSNFVMASQKPMFSLPSWKIAYTVVPLYVALGVIIICVLSALFAAQVNHGLTPAQAFRKGSTAKHGKRVLLERFPAIWNKIPFGNRWSIRDNLGNKVQMLMGLIGVIGGLALVMTGFGTKNSMDNQVDQTYGHEYVYAKKMNLSNNTSQSEINRITKQVHGEKIESVYSSLQPKGEFDRPLTILDSGSKIKLKTENQQKIKNGGVYVAEGIAKTAHIKKNQTIRLQPSFSDKTIKLKVKGIIKSSAPQGIYMTKKTWQDQGMTFKPTAILTSRHQIPQKIKNNLAVTQVVSLKEQKSNAKEMVNNLSSIFLMIQVFGILLTIVILYNLGSLSFTERSRSYATLEILGFSRNQIRNLTIIENLTITSLGWLIGVPFGYWFLSRYVTTFNTSQIIYYPFISTISIALASIIVVAAALSTVGMMGSRLKKLDMIASTKGVE